MDKKLEKKLEERLKKIYGESSGAAKAVHEISKKLSRYEPRTGVKRCFSEKDSILITYGDTITDGERPGLEVLEEFLGEYVKDAVNTVHILPMYPYTSDDGFSVVDYRQIHPALGTWKEVDRLAEKNGLMFDAVINHISRSSAWFEKYLRGEEPYRSYFITCDPEKDYHTVTRPRALPLLTKVETKEGERFVWTTFSEDQIDLNYRCPQLLAEILDILIMYARRGAEYIRLDAVGFMWKEPGSTCINLPQTHELIRLMKDVLNVYAPGTKIVTETNVPHEENIRYFGVNGDEADLIYQFALPPLVLHTFLKGESETLARWLESLDLLSDKVTYLNFLSSHDGIGLRPVEDILSIQDRADLVEAALRSGGSVSYKDNGDGTRSPYELNINYQDALAGPDESDEDRVGKFLAAEIILLSLKGIPGIYIHSLLGSRNDYYGRETSGIPRRINRERLSRAYIKNQLEENTNRRKIFKRLMHALRVRRCETAFSPLADQEILRLNRQVFSAVRENRETGEKSYVLVNVSGKPQKIFCENLKGYDILSGKKTENTIRLDPWDYMWVKVQ